VFLSGGEGLILRISNLGEGFEYDQAAVQLRSEGLPIPEFLEVVRHWIITMHCHVAI